MPSGLPSSSYKSPPNSLGDPDPPAGLDKGRRLGSLESKGSPLSLPLGQPSLQELKISEESGPESPPKSQPEPLPPSPPRSSSQEGSPVQERPPQSSVSKQPTESEFNSWGLVKIRSELSVAGIAFDNKASLQALKKVFCLYMANQVKSSKRSRGSPGYQSPSKQIREPGRRFGPAEKPGELV